MKDNNLIVIKLSKNKRGKLNPTVLVYHQIDCKTPEQLETYSKLKNSLFKRDHPPA